MVLEDMVMGNIEGTLNLFFLFWWVSRTSGMYEIHKKNIKVSEVVGIVVLFMGRRCYWFELSTPLV